MRITEDWQIIIRNRMKTTTDDWLDPVRWTCVRCGCVFLTPALNPPCPRFGLRESLS
jgi:hypothetical protein